MVVCVHTQSHCETPGNLTNYTNAKLKSYSASLKHKLSSDCPWEKIRAW